MTLSKIVLLSNYLRLQWINCCFVFSVKISKFLLIIFFCKQQTISNRMSYFILYSSMTKISTFRDNKQNSLISLMAKRFLKVISYACAPYIFFNSVCIWVKVLSGTKNKRIHTINGHLNRHQEHLESINIFFLSKYVRPYNLDEK